MKNKCKYSAYCGGCSLQGISYEKQLIKKQEYIDSLLNKFCKVNKIIRMEDPLYYRNKVQVSFGYDDNHRVICGNYVPSTHIIVPIEECMISDSKSIEIILKIKELINKHKISIFNEHSLRGGIRHVQIRCTSLNEYMIIFVAGNKRVNKLDLLIKDLLRHFKEIKTVILNVNNKHTSMVLSNTNLVLYGKGFIYDDLCGLKFKLSASSFYQVNKRQTEVLYRTAIDSIKFNKNEIVIDAYCGIGTIGLIVSKKIKKLIGVELNKQAIKDAVYNMKLNNIKNAEFIKDDAGHFMNRLVKDRFRGDSVIMDPPRSGADIRFLSSLVKLSPNKILYISCGPESLRNNLKYLVKNNYIVDSIQPVDMFPYTDHVETIVVLKSTKE